MSDTIEILYKCVCLAEQVKIKVPARRGPSHDVASWVEDIVSPRISADHARLSPMCRSDIMEFMKIPVPPEGGYVGQAEQEKS